ncbi:hypothetical protein DICSQDRAFT_162948 [Dichomitus squalens LYAD-421 SS1]|uniref:Uncharacterized protein n=1 Tax=Dichomitus squalens (strain LYAD-421) TaxID=732165 RepID=R7SQ86_DICSQ|nr:uncharacterized protein DICSQDRAFT_162948 [Dichomitus squalens LYAD-421 SS1]EJF58354.1 hypothetical protein DICSQDRAFT_162948 [Dichomitus squalens LYAD-421 SS1]
MATCGLLYHEGAKIIIGRGITLKGPEERASSLLRFLAAEDLSRCSYVRALSIEIETIPESVAEGLIPILPRMSSLEFLSATPEKMLEPYPDLFQAFAAIRSLRRLEVIGVGEHSIRLIQALQSKLVSAVLYFSYDTHLRNTSHPIQMLEGSASTLEQLTCGGFVDISAEPQLMALTTTTASKITYPKMRSLALVNNLVPHPIPYIRSFPNLTHLSIKSLHTVPLDDALGDLVHIRRRLNLIMQEQDEDGDARSWDHLEHFFGRLVDLWALGLTCQIHILSLEDRPGRRVPSALADVLRYARPSELQLSFYGGSLQGVIAADFLMNVDLMAEDRDVDAARILANFETAIAGLQIQQLKLWVADIALSDSEETPGRFTSEVAEHDADTLTPSGTYMEASSLDGTARLCACVGSVTHASLCMAERTLAAFDVEAYTHRLVSAAPAIKNMVISIETPRRCGGDNRFAVFGIEHGPAPTWHTEGKIVYQRVSAAKWVEIMRDRAMLSLMSGHRQAA